MDPSSSLGKAIAWGVSACIATIFVAGYWRKLDPVDGPTFGGSIIFGLIIGSVVTFIYTWRKHDPRWKQQPPEDDHNPPTT